jgi:hypothetical protein
MSYRCRGHCVQCAEYCFHPVRYTGAPLPAALATKVGVYDAVVPGDNAAFLKAAVDFAAGKAGSDLIARRLCNGTAKSPAAGVFEAKRKQYAKQRAGEIAPQAIITCIEASTDRDFTAGMKASPHVHVPMLHTSPLHTVISQSL